MAWLQDGCPIRFHLTVKEKPGKKVSTYQRTT
jgi:hypothetical protein